MAATRPVQPNTPKGPVEAQIPPENITISGSGPWRRFFEALWRRLGGFQDDVYNGFVDSAGLQARIYQFEQGLEEARFEASAARQQIFAILADRREIEELRIQVTTAQQQTSTLAQKLVQAEEERAKDQQQAQFQSQSLIQQQAANKYDLDHKVATIVEGDAGLTTDAVTEGLANLYYTDARARGAVSATAGSIVQYNSTTGEFSTRPTTGWTSPTGTALRAGYATYTAPTVSAAYVQAEVQAIADAQQATSRTLKALVDDLTTRSVIAP